MVCTHTCKQAPLINYFPLLNQINWEIFLLTLGSKHKRPSMGHLVPPASTFSVSGSALDSAAVFGSRKRQTLTLARLYRGSVVSTGLPAWITDDPQGNAQIQEEVG